MLDNLRGMAVFASVVEHGSFSGSARELGITTVSYTHLTLPTIYSV